jgi:GNAT superfamily N-acetyltransferase
MVVGRMTDHIADQIDTVSVDDVELRESILGYDIYVEGHHAGGIEGVPGKFDYIEVSPHWEGKGVARAALRAFMQLSREAGHTEIVTTNATHPVMEHILDTMGFEQDPDGTGLIKDISDTDGETT